MPKISSKLVSLSFGILVLIFAFAFYISAWTEPAAVPPGSNAATPLNVSNVGQSKAGGLILNTGGAPVGLIVQNGSVGIGTTDPQSPLHILRTGIANDPFIRFSLPDEPLEGPEWSLGVNDEQPYNFFEINRGTSLEYAAGDFVIGATGNIGFGTSTPTAPLQISRSGSGVDSWIDFNLYDETDHWSMGVNDETSNFFQIAHDRTLNSSSPYFSISSTGNVGIGTITPGYKLDVAGSINANQVCIAGNCTGSSSGSSGGLMTGNGSDGDVVISSSQSIPKRVMQYNNLTINSGSTLSGLSGTSFILVKGKLTVGGILSAESAGAAGGGQIVGNGYSFNGTYAYGGGGGQGATVAFLDGLSKTMFFSPFVVSSIGGGAAGGGSGSAVASGGVIGSNGDILTIAANGGAKGTSNITSGVAAGSTGAGGAGGGILIIRANEIEVLTGGVISVNGSNGGNAVQYQPTCGGIANACTAGGGGGAGGGLLIIVTPKITNNGTVRADGGNGGSGVGLIGYGGSGGNGGVVYLFTGIKLGTGVTNVNGGGAGTGPKGSGSAGTAGNIYEMGL